MKHSYLFILAIFASISSFSQTIVNTRGAELEDANYSISGNATLNELSDGSLQLVLSDDYATAAGPDIRIYLTNTTSLNDSYQVVNLTTLPNNGFSGEQTFIVPNKEDGTPVGINEYDRLIFFCLRFNQTWARGNFGTVVDIVEDSMCEDNATATTAWEPEVSICPTDSEDDIIPLKTTSSATIGTNYAFLLTDENEIVQKIITTEEYNFEGSGTETQRIYGIHYSGTLDAVIGENRIQTTATECHQHSSESLFLTINKIECEPEPQCSESFTATTAWITDSNICSIDESSNNIALLTTIEVTIGQNYAFLITDENEIVQKVVMDSVYDFEGSGTETQRVYGINYEGTLNTVIGENRNQTTADGCHIHSGEDLFLTISKTDCPTGLESTNDIIINLFPNPANDILFVELPNNFSTSTYSILNLQGNLIKTGSIQESKIDVSNIETGNYIINFLSDSKSVSKKLIIKK